MFEISFPAIGAIGTVLAAFAIILGFWSRFSERVTKAQGTAESASIKADTAAMAALAAKLETDRLQRDLSEYQIKAAGTFITDTELSAVEHRIESSVAEIKNDIKGVNARLDRVLDGRESGRP